MTSKVDWEFRATYLSEQAIYLETKAEEMISEAKRYRGLAEQAQYLARHSGDESGCARKCVEADDSGGSGIDRNSEDTTQGDRPAAVVKVPSPECQHRRTDWHYDSQGYCDNPGRGY